MTAQIIQLRPPKIAYSGSPEMQRAERLERELRVKLRGRQDWLMEYRKWLDSKGIKAETNGWPSEQAYDLRNVGDFIQYQLMVY
jgi:hypothetical protein